MGKIEGLICRTLNKVLGNFVEDISADSLNLAVLSGRASLKNLQVRPECIQEMGLPVKLNAGLIGSIVIDIPITSLLSKPIVVTIRDILVSLSPDRDVKLKRVLLKKQLHDWNSLADVEPAVDETQDEAAAAESDSVTAKFVKKIIVHHPPLNFYSGVFAVATLAFIRFA